MVNPVGLRFCPTDSEIVDHYLRLKNLGETPNHFGEVMNTLNIYSFDPWDLPSQSKIKSEDKVWYFFSRKENKFRRSERQRRKTKSGFWKITGKPMKIMGKSYGKRPQERMIGEKKVLVFNSNKNLGDRSKSDWVMHEYHSVFSSPAQMTTYTVCRVHFKGEASDISSSACENNHMNNSEQLTTAFEGSSFDRLHSQELQNPRQLSGFFEVEQKCSSKMQFKRFSTICQVLIGNICNNNKP